MARASVLQSDSPTGFFPRLARWCEQQVSRPGASGAAIAFVALWFVSGPLYGWSNAAPVVGHTTPPPRPPAGDGFSDPGPARAPHPGQPAEARRGGPG